MQITSDELFEEAFFIFTQGCNNKYCLSPDCKNFIYKDSTSIEDPVAFILQKIESKNLMIFCSENYNISRAHDKQKKDIINLFQSIYTPHDQKIEYQYALESYNKQNQLDEEQLQKCLADFYNCLFCIKKSKIQFDDKLKNFFLQTLLTFQQLLFNKIAENLISYRNIIYVLCSEDFSNQIENFEFEEFIEYSKALMLELKILKQYLNKLNQNELNCLHILLQIMKLNFDRKKYQRDLYYFEDILEKEEIYKEELKYLVDIYTKNNQQHPLSSYGLGLMMWQSNIKFFEYNFIFTTNQKFDMIKWEKKQCEEIEKCRLQQAIFLNPFLTEQSHYELYFNLKVDRQTIVQDTFQQLKQNFNQFSIKKILKIEFLNEIGQDTGGLKREFFYCISQQIIEQEKLVQKINNYFYWLDQQESDQFFLLGQIFGLALLNNEVLTFNFPLLFYKFLLNKQSKFELQDLQDIDQQLHTSLKNLLKSDLQDQELDYVYFDFDGNEYKQEDKKITQQNKQEFVEQYVNSYLMNLIQKQNFQLLRKGFYSVSQFYILTIFEPQDLQIALQGKQEINYQKIKKYTKYFQWNQDDLTIVYLWDILEEFELNEKKKFLQFLTGSTKLPLQGEEALHIKIKKQQNQDYLPIAQTCSNTLFLREYKSKEELKKHILLCIQGNQGFYLA